MDTTTYLALLGFIVANAAVASSGAIFRPGRWYDNLAKPSWQPPGWLFGPVWSLLYAMIAVSGWLVWLKAGFSGAPLAFAVYALNLIFNAAWSGLFFGLKRMGLAAVEMVGLWATIVALIALFWPIDVWAALLLVPYLAWVSFAFVLNITVWRLNRGQAQPA
jgi:tryptophan-rich sensory protein